MPEGSAAKHSDPLVNQFNELEGLYGAYFGEVRRDHSFYDLHFAGEIVPEEWREKLVPLVPPTARIAVDEAADHILTTPKVKVPVRQVEGDHLKQTTIAENKRKFINSFWHTTIGLTNPLDQAKKALLLDGKVIVKKTLRWDLIPKKGTTTKSKAKYRSDLKKLGRIEFLWNTEVIPTEYVFEDPDNHRDPKYVYLKYKVRRAEAKRLFPKSKSSWNTSDKEGGAYDHLDYMEYWSKPKFLPDGTWEPGEYIQWIENEREHEDDNPYPYIPLAIEDAGFGKLTPEPKPEDKYVSFIASMRDIFVAEARQMTSWQAVLEMTAFPMTTVRNFDDEKDVVAGPGAINRLEGDEGEPGAESMQFEKLPEIPVGLLQFVDKTTEMANSSLKIGILGGQPQRGVETATEADSNFRNAAVKLSGPVSALERLVKKLNRWVFMDIELVLEAPVTIYGAAANAPSEVQVMPKDIQGYYESHVELTTADKDALNQVQARFWAEMYRVVPFLSLYTAMEKMGLEDPQEEMMKRAAEDVFLSPQFQTLRTFTGAQSFGELNQMISSLGLAEGGNQEGQGGVQPNPGANSAESLIGQGGGPLQQELTQNALTSRDVLRGDSQLR
jgi:hypothetical protein